MKASTFSRPPLGLESFCMAPIKRSNAADFWLMAGPLSLVSSLYWIIRIWRKKRTENGRPRMALDPGRLLPQSKCRVVCRRHLKLRRKEHPMRRRVFLAGILTALLWSGSISGADDNEPIKVLIITGDH